MMLCGLTLLLTAVMTAGSMLDAAGGGFGGAPIRSRLVGDGNLPDDPPVVLAPQRGPPPDAAARANAWRPGAEGATPPDRWNGAAPLVSSALYQQASRHNSSSCLGFGWLKQQQHTWNASSSYHAAHTVLSQSIVGFSTTMGTVDKAL